MDHRDKIDLENLKHANNLERDKKRAEERSRQQDSSRTDREETEKKRRADQKSRTQDQRAYAEEKERQRREYAEQKHRERTDERRKYADEKTDERRRYQEAQREETAEQRLEGEKIRAKSAETLEKLRQSFSEREISLMFEDYKKRGDFDHNLYLQRLQAEMQAGVMVHMMKQFIDLQVWKTKQLFSYLIRRKEQESLTDGELNDILRGIEMH